LISHQLAATITDHTQGVSAVTFSPDDRRLAIGGRDNTTTLWDVDNQRSLDTFHGPQLPMGAIDYSHIDSVAFSPDGNLLATGSSHIYTFTVQVWNSRSGQLLRTIEEPIQPQTESALTERVSVAFGLDGNTLNETN
jgi:WD40 repeat protein